MTKSVYENITEKIIGKLEKGVVPWLPWTNSNAVNWKTQKPYQGTNVFLLEPWEYATKKQPFLNKKYRSQKCTFSNIQTAANDVLCQIVMDEYKENSL